MKVIFLDIEGVLNTKETYERYQRTYGYTAMMDLKLDFFRLEYLKNIIDSTGAKIVLSSSFRYFFTKKAEKIVPTNLKGQKLYNFFENCGISIYDVTSLSMKSREEQIKEWLLKRDDVESFVIIDDDQTAFEDLKDNLVLTSSIRKNYLSSFLKDSSGLNENNVYEAIDILNKKEKVLKNVISKSVKKFE